MQDEDDERQDLERALYARPTGDDRDEALRARLAAAARARAQEFDEDAFSQRWRELAARHELL